MIYFKSYRDNFKTPHFVSRPLAGRQAQILILEILHVFTPRAFTTRHLWLKFSPSLTLNKLKRFKTGSYNQSKFKTFLISVFFLLFVFSCNDIKKEDEERPSDNIPAGNTQTVGTMKTGKFPSGLYYSKSNEYVKDQIIVKFAKGTDPKTISVIQKELRLETLRTFSSPDLFLMKITDNTPVKNIIKSLNNYKEVKYSEPNYKMSINSRKGRKP